MKPVDVSIVSKEFKRLISEEELNQLGKATLFCRREREITPYRLALALMETMSNGSVRAIADIQRGFNALCGKGVQYKPFHKQLAKASFPTFMRALCERLMSRVTNDTLAFDARSPFARFKHIMLHDGTSFGLKSALKEYFPGRFTTLKPAAVELHVTLDLLSEGLNSVILAPDTESEVVNAPEPESVKDSLLLADRMFFVKKYLADIQRAGGHYLVKAKSVLNPTIRHAYRPDGTEVKAWARKSLNDVKSSLSRHSHYDLDVEWGKSGSVLKARLLVTWNPVKKQLQYLLTNLERGMFTHQHIVDAYRLRWQIELLFKEWKSHCTLRAFDTANPDIAEGLIWASLCTAIVKRYWTHAAQQVKQTMMSTMKTARCIMHVLPDILKAHMHHPRKLASTIDNALNYLATNAARAHPKRDQRTGRLKLGLMPVFSGA